MSQTLLCPPETPPAQDEDPAACTPLVDRPASRLDGLRAWWRRHPDLGPLSVVLAIGLLMRLALLYRVPPLFMPGDSQSFLGPAYDLARGYGFDPILKRPLGYPLLLAVVIATLGEDLRSLVFVQAMLGLVTVTATYWIGRLVFGRTAGVVAALTVALGGQLLIYEHYILAETTFAALVLLAVLALVVAARNPDGWRAAACGGLAIAAASLFRPIAEVMVPLVPIYFLVVVRPAQRALVLAGFAGLGFVGLMLPAFGADLVLRGGVSSSALGEHLLWRLTRSESGYITRADIPQGEPATPRDAARRYVLRKAVDRTLPQEIFTGLRRELGMSAAEADAIMREIALEAIWRQPTRYLSSTLRMTAELFLADDQALGEISKRDGDAGYINPQSRQRTWFDERIFHLGEPPAPAVQNEFTSAERLTSLYQPGRFQWLILLGCVAGAAVTILRRQYRPGLLLALTIPPVLLANAALAGPEPRFRYPIDPLIAVLAVGGLVTLLTHARGLGRRRRQSESDST